MTIRARGGLELMFKEEEPPCEVSHWPSEAYRDGAGTEPGGRGTAAGLLGRFQTLPEQSGIMPG